MSTVPTCLTPERAAEVTLQPLRRFVLDAAILFSDILIVPYALGQPLEYCDGEGSVLEPLRSAADIAGLSDSDFRDRIAARWPTVERVKELLRRTRRSLGLVRILGDPGILRAMKTLVALALAALYVWWNLPLARRGVPHDRTQLEILQNCYRLARRHRGAQSSDTAKQSLLPHI